MTKYRYACGQHVTFTDKLILGATWSGDFVVTEQLPSGDETPRYQIKRASEPYCRAAFEHQLSAATFVVSG